MHELCTSPGFLNWWWEISGPFFDNTIFVCFCVMFEWLMLGLFCYFYYCFMLPKKNILFLYWKTYALRMQKKKKNILVFHWLELFFIICYSAWNLLFFILFGLSFKISFMFITNFCSSKMCFIAVVEIYWRKLGLKNLTSKFLHVFF